MNPAPINDYIRQLEKDLIDAKHLLHSGLETSLAHLRGAADNVKATLCSEAKAKLTTLEVLAEDAIDKIEKRVGELNYLAAEEDFEGPENFDQLAAPLAKSLHEARLEVAKLDEKGQGELAGLPGDISSAWRDLHLSLEVVSLQLKLLDFENEERVAEARARLVKEFDQAATDAAKAQHEHDATTLVERLWKGIREVPLATTEGLSVFFGAAKRPGEEPTRLGDIPD